MTTLEKRNTVYMAISGLVLFLLSAFCFLFFLTGCSSPTPAPRSLTDQVPHLALVDEPAIYRGGQPTLAGWQWLRQAGVSNVIKLNQIEEASDRQAIALGMTLYYHPIDTLQQLITGPSPADIDAALTEITPGTFIHCQHGQDRTGLLVGLYRITPRSPISPVWPRDQAWQEMTNHGFHPALLGLTKYWQSQ